MSELEAMSPTQRLTYVLCLFLTAPTDEKALLVGEMLAFFADGLTEKQINGCKAMAHEITERGV